MLLVSLDGKIFSGFVEYKEGMPCRWSAHLKIFSGMPRHEDRDYAALRGWRIEEVGR
jgi:hypothetical protein